MRIFENYFVFFTSMLRMIFVASDDEHQQFYTDLLDLHNKYRAKHGEEELLLDNKISRAAMQIAKNLEKGTDTHIDLDIGMNIFFEKHISNLNARDVFFFWYNEVTKFTYKDDPVMRSNTSSFTQIVWRSTKLLGVAVYPGKRFVIIVATYFPSGNNVDEYMMNVVPIVDRKEGSSSNWEIEKRKIDV